MSNDYGRAALLLQALLLVGCDRGAERVPANAADAAMNTAAPAPVQAPVGEARMVLAFGDSLYAGYGLPRGASLPDVLQNRLRAAGINATVVNAGVSGDTTAAGRARLAFALDGLPKKPDLVLLGLGGNDVLRQIAPAETRANLIAMMDELKRRRIPVVLTGMRAPPNLGPEFATSFDTIWPDLARRYDAALYPFILDGIITDRALMLPDRVHPAAAGVNRIADRLTPVVQARLAS